MLLDVVEDDEPFTRQYERQRVLDYLWGFRYYKILISLAARTAILRRG